MPVNDIHNDIAHHVLVIDGAMGTMIQRRGLSESDFRGKAFADSLCRLQGCNDVLVVTQPSVIADIHRQYLDAGAHIIETNTFNANTISLGEYGLADEAYSISRAGAEVARGAVRQWLEAHPGCSGRYVAGSIGPTNKSLSLSPNVEDAAARAITWSELASAYEPQIRGLIDGGVDLLLVETVFDTLNAKCALHTATRVMHEMGRQVPMMLSVTLTESGRTLSGQTVEAMLASVSNFNLLSVGFNCGFGAERLVPYVEHLAAITTHFISLYPNAGLPNEMGEYTESPETMVAHLKPLLADGKINIVGGCCGTTPEHIAAIARAVEGLKPFVPAKPALELVLSGLETLRVSHDVNFINIGERCNVAGSRKFLRLIKEHNYGEAVSIARTQVENGAQIIDINMDDGMIDAVSEITTFINLISSDPDIARVPIMIDTSDWNVVEHALPLLQGKGIVNSISLKEGEERFVEHARFINGMGAAMVVMAFDEQGQATTYDRKVEICRRSYEILTQKVGVRGCDIIFDPNVLAVATGISEHNDYARDYINATRWIKQNLPGAKVSGGISNLSFSFRGNDFVRQSMHSVFLYYAIKEGLDMAIVNAGSIIPFDDVPEVLRRSIERVFFNPSDDAVDELVRIAANYAKDKIAVAEEAHEQIDNPVEALKNAIIRGRSENIEQLLEMSLNAIGSAFHVIDGPLMDAMNCVGELFGAGKLFLPQVVKSARTMKEAVKWLNPYIEQENSNSQRASHRIVLATVKGDVHDIGKNIVSVVMRCNGFDVVDLGTMVPAEQILDEAERCKADVIGLSGLITPSLSEMCNVASLMQQRGMQLPLMVGGAAASEIHTAVKIAPCYSGPVIYTHNAAMVPVEAKAVLDDPDGYSMRLAERQQAMRERHMVAKSLVTLDQARSRALKLDWDSFVPCIPTVDKATIAIDIDDIRGFINWRPFFVAWKLDAAYAQIADIKGCDCNKAAWLASQPNNKVLEAASAMQLYKEAMRAVDDMAVRASKSIKATVAFWKVRSKDDCLVFDRQNVTIPMLRQQKDEAVTLSLADFVSPKGDDYVATFAVTVGDGIASLIQQKKADGDDYSAMVYETVAARLVEASAEYFHRKVARDIWRYAETEDVSIGIRPAVGYPSMPDQSVIFDINRLMPLAPIGISLTENGAMNPSASICGMIFANPSSRYFVIDGIDDEARSRYAAIRGYGDDEIAKWLKI